MNYVDARIEFQRATEAALEALRRESKQQVREALMQYWLAKKRLRIAKAATIGNRRFMTANLAVQSLPSKTKTSTIMSTRPSPPPP
jgi:predicted ATPase